MHMKNGKDCDDVTFRREEHAVREIANERSPSAFFNSRKLKRILQESREDLIDLRLKAETEVSTLALVSKRRLEDLELGLRRDVEPPHSPSSAEAGQQLFADFRPRAGSHFAATVGCEAFGDDLPVPVRHRDLLGMLGEMIPERLDVFELLVRRQLVEAWRRKRRLRHHQSISPRNRFKSRSAVTTDLPARARFPLSEQDVMTFRLLPGGE